MPPETTAAKIIPYAPRRDTRKSETALKNISEVAKELGVETHVLRFWEKKFPEIEPLLRSGGRRYYAKEMVILLHEIKDLLYKERYTIKGVQQLLKAGKKKKKDTEGTVSVRKEESMMEEKKTPEKTTAALRKELEGLRDFLADTLLKSQ